MRTIPKIATGWAGGGIAVLLALVLALRVAALPMVMAGGAPGPGMMAICTGSEIIYIPIGGNSPADPGERAAHDPCPAFGITAALDLPDLRVPAPTGRLVALVPQVGNPSRATRPMPAAHRPRAPPSSDLTLTSSRQITGPLLRARSKRTTQCSNEPLARPLPAPGCWPPWPRPRPCRR